MSTEIRNKAMSDEERRMLMEKMDKDIDDFIEELARK